MPLYGSCDQCGGETIDYSCVNCLGASIDRLKDENSALQAELAKVRTQLETEVRDWADTDTAVREAARPVLGAWVDGDADSTPGVVEIVKELSDLVCRKCNVRSDT